MIELFFMKLGLIIRNYMAYLLVKNKIAGLLIKNLRGLNNDFL